MARALQPNQDDEITFTEVVTDEDIEQIDHPLDTTVELHAIDGVEQQGDDRTPWWLSATVSEVGDTGNAWKEEVHVTVDKNGLSEDTVYTFLFRATDGIDTVDLLRELDVSTVLPPNSRDGTKLYMVDDDNPLYEADLPTAWDPSTYTVGQTRDMEDVGTGGGYCVRFNPDGTRMYFFDSDQAVIYQYDLPTAWDISTASKVGESPEGESFSCSNFQFRPNGEEIWFVDGNENVQKAPLSTAWDVTTLSLGSSWSVGGLDSLMQSIVWSPDGTKAFLLGTGNEQIWGFEMETPWDFSTRTQTGSYDWSGDTSSTHIQGFYIKHDGKRLFLYHWSSGDDIYDYSMSTAWDIETLTLEQTVDFSEADNPRFAEVGVGV